MGFMGFTRPIFGAVSYVWGLNIPEKFQVVAQGHHTGKPGLYSCILPNIRAASCPQLDTCAQNFCGVIYYVSQSTNVESLAFLTHFVLYESANIAFHTVALPIWACLSALRVKSVETWRWMATNQLSTRKPGARSQYFR